MAYELCCDRFCRILYFSVCFLRYKPYIGFIKVLTCWYVALHSFRYIKRVSPPAYKVPAADSLLCERTTSLERVASPIHISRDASSHSIYSENSSLSDTLLRQGSNEDILHLRHRTSTNEDVITTINYKACVDNSPSRFSEV